MKKLTKKQQAWQDFLKIDNFVSSTCETWLESADEEYEESVGKTLTALNRLRNYIKTRR